MSEQIQKAGAEPEAAAQERLTSRRAFVESAAIVGLGMTTLSASAQHAMPDASHMAEEIKKEKIRRAMLAGPTSITSQATVDAALAGAAAKIKPLAAKK